MYTVDKPNYGYSGYVLRSEFLYTDYLKSRNPPIYKGVSFILRVFR